MPKFLTKQEIFRLLQRELPENVYCDGEPEEFLSTAENDSVAKVVESVYQNLERIYFNFFAQDSNEKIADWEFRHFGAPQDATLPLSERVNRLLAKIRSQNGITKADLLSEIYTLIPIAVKVEIAEWNCPEGGWSLGESELGLGTILNAYSGYEPGFQRINYCEKTAADLGLTDEQYLLLRKQAFTYEVRLYSYTMATKEREDLEKILRKYEPARSGHVVLENFVP